MSGHGMLKYFRPITHKKDEDPPEGKELSNLSWPYLLKVIPPSSGPALRIGKLGSCLGPPSKRGPQDSTGTAKQYLIGTELNT